MPMIKYKGKIKKFAYTRLGLLQAQMLLRKPGAKRVTSLRYVPGFDSLKSSSKRVKYYKKRKYKKRRY